jgi:hypothetical protein
MTTVQRCLRAVFLIIVISLFCAPSLLANTYSVDGSATYNGDILGLGAICH